MDQGMKVNMNKTKVLISIESRMIEVS